MARKPEFKTEADLVAAFCEAIDSQNENRNAPTWAAYHETCGWDLLMVESGTGVQVGIEAKLVLNTKVLLQALPSRSYHDRPGPDYRAVLVPSGGLQADIQTLAGHVGVDVIQVYDQSGGWRGPKWAFTPLLPREENYWGVDKWLPWLPSERHTLPDYVPDVLGGKPSPITLTDWKIRAIKLMIVLEHYGFVTRKDMAILKISPTRWTGHNAFLARGDRGYIRCEWTPNFRAQHPINYEQIAADWDIWGKEIRDARGE